MADRRRKAARTGLIGPLALLTGGAMAGVFFWWLLMLDPVPRPGLPSAGERLSGHDRTALDSLLDRGPAKP